MADQSIVGAFAKQSGLRNNSPHPRPAPKIKQFNRLCSPKKRQRQLSTITKEFFKLFSVYYLVKVLMMEPVIGEGEARADPQFLPEGWLQGRRVKDLSS